MTAADFVLTKDTPARRLWTWRGWEIDEWDSGVCVLLHSDRMHFMEFGSLAELQALAAELEHAKGASL